MGGFYDPFWGYPYYAYRPYWGGGYYRPWGGYYAPNYRARNVDYIDRTGNRFRNNNYNGGFRNGNMSNNGNWGNSNNQGVITTMVSETQVSDKIPAIVCHRHSSQTGTTTDHLILVSEAVTALAAEEAAAVASEEVQVVVPDSDQEAEDKNGLG